jgi:hypothetical protein
MSTPNTRMYTSKQSGTGGALIWPLNGFKPFALNENVLE